MLASSLLLPSDLDLWQVATTVKPSAKVVADKDAEPTRHFGVLHSSLPPRHRYEPEAWIPIIGSHLLSYSDLAISSPPSHGHQDPGPQQSFNFWQHSAFSQFHSCSSPHKPPPWLLWSSSSSPDALVKNPQYASTNVFPGRHQSSTVVSSLLFPHSVSNPQNTHSWGCYLSRPSCPPVPSALRGPHIDPTRRSSHQRSWTQKWVFHDWNSVMGGNSWYLEVGRIRWVPLSQSLWLYTGKEIAVLHAKSKHEAINETRLSVLNKKSVLGCHSWLVALVGRSGHTNPVFCNTFQDSLHAEFSWTDFLIFKDRFWLQVYPDNFGLLFSQSKGFAYLFNTCYN